MEFKDRLKQLRTESDLTQQELADKLGFGYSRTAVSAWEVGINEPSNSDTIKIADFFKVSTDYILGKTDKKNNNELDFFDKYKEYTKDLTDEEIKMALEFYKNIKEMKNK